MLVNKQTAIPNLKFPTPPRSMILLFFQTVHEFSTNMRMSERTFEYSRPIRGWFAAQIAQIGDYWGSDLELLISKEKFQQFPGSLLILRPNYF
jgi:hypothetical protein